MSHEIFIRNLIPNKINQKNTPDSFPFVIIISIVDYISLNKKYLSASSLSSHSFNKK